MASHFLCIVECNIRYQIYYISCLSFKILLLNLNLNPQPFYMKVLFIVNQIYLTYKISILVNKISYMLHGISYAYNIL